MRSFQPETKLNNDANPSLSNERVMKIVAYLDENTKRKLLWIILLPLPAIIRAIYHRL